MLIQTRGPEVSEHQEQHGTQKTEGKCVSFMTKPEKEFEKLKERLGGRKI